MKGLCLAGVAWAAMAPVLGAVKPWEPHEIALTARDAMADPYTAGLPDDGPPFVSVSFTGQSGSARGSKYTVSGFWDGGRQWKARFAPPSAGEWSYLTQSRDPGLNGLRGTLRSEDWSPEEKAANPVRRGFVRVARSGPRPGRYFEYADGTPFLWIGDTWWDWAKPGIRPATFQKLADNRAAKGFSVGQLHIGGSLGLTGTQPDLEQLRKVEGMIAYANSRGITVWIHPLWGGKGLAERYTPEKLRRWWRHVLARFGAYNVIWVLAGEYNMDNYSGLGLTFWKDLGRLLRREDPYRRLIGVHPTPPGWAGGVSAPQWSTGEVLHGEPWLDYDQSQVGHGRWRNEMIPPVVAADYSRRPAKPAVVTEPWYEFVDGNPSPEDIRFGAWSALLSGAAGHTYGGGHVWWAHVPESPMGPSPWPMQREFDTDTPDYPGAVSISYLAKFLRSIDWWKLEPHPELVHDNPSRYCAADPGREYVVYLRWGGAARIDLRGGAERLGYEWIDLSLGRVAQSGQAAGGGIREFRPPEDYPRHRNYKDWVLHIRR